MNRNYPEKLAIAPLPHPPSCHLRPPGSKSITNRALVLAALSDPLQGSTLQGCLQSEDTEVMVECLRELGFHLRADWEKGTIHVCRGNTTRLIPAQRASLFTANSGTTMRFLTALVSLGQGRYRLDGIARMRERPLEDLLDALKQLGVRITCEGHPGFPPVVIDAHGLDGGTVRIRADVSSQFLSGLLLAAPLARSGITLLIEGSLVSQPYVGMTLRMMEQFGVRVEHPGPSRYDVPATPYYDSRQYTVEPDASAASYFLGAAAITGGDVTIIGLGHRSLQGDVRFVHLLDEMGCNVLCQENSIQVIGGSLTGIDADMNDISDCVMTLAAVACFAQGPTTIRNVAHIRHKETDRIQALATELRRLGAGVEELSDGLRIIPRPLTGAIVETYNDHRMAMSLALIGLRIPGVVLSNPGCVSKTYPGFFDDLDLLRKPL